MARFTRVPEPKLRLLNRVGLWKSPRSVVVSEYKYDRENVIRIVQNFRDTEKRTEGTVHQANAETADWVLHLLEAKRA